MWPSGSGSSLQNYLPQFESLLLNVEMWRVVCYYKPMSNRKEYLKSYHRKWYLETVKPRREKFFSDKKCEWCGSTESLELHHLDPSKKLGHNIWSWSEKRRSAEINKCIVLCKKCHHDYHNSLRIKHGLGRYKRGCRCDICRKAKSIDNAKRVRRKAAS